MPDTIQVEKENETIKIEKEADRLLPHAEDSDGPEAVFAGAVDLHAQVEIAKFLAANYRFAAAMQKIMGLAVQASAAYHHNSELSSQAVVNDLEQIVRYLRAIVQVDSNPEPVDLEVTYPFDEMADLKSWSIQLAMIEQAEKSGTPIPVNPDLMVGSKAR